MFTAAGTANLAHVTGINRYVLSNGTNSLIYATGNCANVPGGLIVVIGSSGNDTIDASAGGGAIDVVAGSGNDRLLGGSGANVFRFAAADLTSADTVVGGSGADDLLLITTAGTIDATTLAGVQHIETIQIGAGGSHLTLTDAVLNANGHALAVISSPGNDVVDASALTAANSVDITAGSGNDTMRGGAGDDSVAVTASNLNAGDTLSGGAGSDTLILTNAGTLDAAALAGVTGFETYQLLAGGVAFTLSDAQFADVTGPIHVTGSSGNDSVNGSSLSAGHALDFVAGAGVDMVSGGANNDVFDFTGVGNFTSGDMIDGGAGDDLLIAGGTLGANLHSIETIQLDPMVTGVNIAEADVVANGEGFTIVANGADTINSTASSFGIIVEANSNNVHFTGGAASDTLVIAINNLTLNTHFDGGDGTDTIAFTTAGRLGLSDFQNIRDIERITLAAGANTIVLGNGIVSNSNPPLNIVGNSGDDVIYGNHFTTSLVLQGGDGNDELRGGSASDTLAGGAGADGFGFDLSGVADTVTDFNTSEGDFLDIIGNEEFKGGSFDTRTIASSTATDISAADLVIYTGSVLDSAMDVENYLATATGGRAPGYLYVVGTDSAGDTVLYHADSSYSHNVHAVADLGHLTSATSIQLSDFRFG